MSPLNLQIGSSAWVKQTGGRLTNEERRKLIWPVMRMHAINISGRLRLLVNPWFTAVSGETVDVAIVPDSNLCKSAENVAADLLSPAILFHSYRSFVWASEIAAREKISFDRELLFLAALFHDSGLPGITNVDFTHKSMDNFREFAHTQQLTKTQCLCIEDAMCMHHTPGVSLKDGAESYLLSMGAAVDVIGYKSWRIKPEIKKAVIEKWPRKQFKKEFLKLWNDEAKSVPDGRAAFLRRYALFDWAIRLAPFREFP